MSVSMAVICCGVYFYWNHFCLFQA